MFLDGSLNFYLMNELCVSSTIIITYIVIILNLILIFTFSFKDDRYFFLNTLN